MATRCGYYTDGFNLFRCVTSIDWNLGFNKEAKTAYINNLVNKLSPTLGVVKDVTTASPEVNTRNLSPHCIKLSDGNYLSDLYSEYGVPGIFDFLYMISLTQEQLELVKSIDCFIDVFHDPYKSSETQAKTLALLKMLILQDRLVLLENIDKFLEWYNDNCLPISINLTE